MPGERPYVLRQKVNYRGAASRHNSGENAAAALELAVCIEFSRFLTFLSPVDSDLQMWCETVCIRV